MWHFLIWFSRCGGIQRLDDLEIFSNLDDSMIEATKLSNLWGSNASLNISKISSISRFILMESLKHLSLTARLRQLSPKLNQCDPWSRSLPHNRLWPNKPNVPILTREEEKEQKSRKKLPQGKKFGECISSTSIDAQDNIQEQNNCH